jgi:fluoride exporter
MAQHRLVASPLFVGYMDRGAVGVRSSPSTCDHCALASQLDGIQKKMLATILVFIGGALGSIWRFWWSGWVAERFGEIFPFGTLAVNVVASALLGLVSGLLLRLGATETATALQQLISVGVCGGLSTFSSFSLQTWNLLMERRWIAAIANIIVSTAVCFASIALGWQASVSAHL